MWCPLALFFHQDEKKFYTDFDDQKKPLSLTRKSLNKASVRRVAERRDSNQRYGSRILRVIRRGVSRSIGVQVGPQSTHGNALYRRINWTSDQGHGWEPIRGAGSTHKPIHNPVNVDGVALFRPHGMSDVGVQSGRQLRAPRGPSLTH